MAEEHFYCYATGKVGEPLGLNYNAYGIIAFTKKNNAYEELEAVLSANPGLEGKVIVITPLIQQGFIQKEKLTIMD